MDRRDRHGRGMRGPLARPPVPLAFSRREEFDELVLSAAERIDAHLVHTGLAAERGMTLADIDFAVEEMPFFDPHDEPDVVPFGRVEPAEGGRRALVVVYRRTIELRSERGEERAELIQDAVAEQIADLFGVDVDEIDPGFD